MNIIDVRKDEQDPVSIITFAEGGAYSSAVEVNCVGGCVFINSAGEVTAGRGGDNEYCEIDTKEDALHLIKALEKALELGWWGE